MCKNARGRFDGPQVVARNECLNVGDYHNCIYYVTKWMFVRVYRCCGILMIEWIWNMNIKVNCGVKEHLLVVSCSVILWNEKNCKAHMEILSVS